MQCINLMSWVWFQLGSQFLLALKCVVVFHRQNYSKIVKYNLILDNWPTFFALAALWPASAQRHLGVCRHRKRRASLATGSNFCVARSAMERRERRQGSKGLWMASLKAEINQMVVIEGKSHTRPHLVIYIYMYSFMKASGPHVSQTGYQTNRICLIFFVNKQ